MRKLLWLPVALLVAATAAPATAMMLKIPLPELTERAKQVLQCRVAGARSMWTADHTAIVTEVTLAVSEAWKGAAPDGGTVTLTVRGGEVGDVGMVSEHAPVFDKDEDTLLFLERRPDGGLRVAGEEQGKYTIVGDWIVGCEHRPVPLADFRADVARYTAAEGR